MKTNLFFELTVRFYSVKTELKFYFLDKENCIAEQLKFSELYDVSFVGIREFRFVDFSKLFVDKK